MGKTPTPLHILIHPDFTEWDEVKELMVKGHIFTSLTLSDIDLILAPQAHLMTEEMRPYLGLAVQTMQKRLNKAKKARKEATS